MKLYEKSIKGLHQEIVRILEPNCYKYETHLDIGAGTGHLSHLFQKYGIVGESYHVDIDKKSFAFKSKNFRIGNLNEKIPYDKKFDLITCVEVIEHLENHSHLLREIKRMSHKDTTIIITSPNIHGLLSKLLFLFDNRFINFMDKDLVVHISPVVNNVFVSLVEDSGLFVENVYFYGFSVPFLGIVLSGRRRWLGGVVIYELSGG